jgi:hypothetical protein
MKATRRGAGPLILTVMVGLTSVACHDAAPIATLDPEPSSVVVRLVLAEGERGSPAIVRAVATAGTGLEPPSAFIARLTLPVGIDSIVDVSSGSGVLRAVHRDGQEVRIAAASTAGMEELFALAVHASPAAQVDGVRLVIDELVDRGGNDLRRVLRLSAHPIRGPRR